MNYSFVAREKDVDYQRIVEEAPEGTQFVLVETRTRNNQTKESILMVHVSVLKSEKIQQHRLGSGRISKKWGYKNSSGPLSSYRFMAFVGPVPGKIMQQIEGLKRDMNPKNTKVVVKLL